jgi:hypothetical protein
MSSSVPNSTPVYPDVDLNKYQTWLDGRYTARSARPSPSKSNRVRDGVGGATVNPTALEVPPPGCGLKTVIGTVTAVWRSAVNISAFNWLPETNVVCRFCPFHRTTEPLK